MVDEWSVRIGVQPKRVQFRTMTRKWGSCSSKNNVTLNQRLTWLPPRLAEYIVCHELVHLRELNHGPQFKALMTTYMPDWKSREQELRALKF
ncbi:MAG: M48 family metallopeptidase [Anaerolineaceae bacterium]|nr:M48 family metallopeptidase [Anaerolineaceae bacterium]